MLKVCREKYRGELDIYIYIYSKSKSHEKNPVLSRDSEEKECGEEIAI